MSKKLRRFSQSKQPVSHPQVAGGSVDRGSDGFCVFQNLFKFLNKLGSVAAGSFFLEQAPIGSSFGTTIAYLNDLLHEFFR